MRIVIDLQGAQTESRLRGIGRYSLALAQELARQCTSHEVFLLLNGAFEESLSPLRNAFADWVPAHRVVVFETPGPVRGCDAANQTRRDCAELLRESLIAELQPDWLLLTSLFEGHVDEAVTSVGKLPRSYRTAVVLYDLIPWLHRPIYLADAQAGAWYDDKIMGLRSADLLLAISESSAAEAIEHLDRAPDSVVTISTAADAFFTVRDVPHDAEARLRKAHGIDGGFLMYTGGADWRKNLKLLVQAYAQLDASLRSRHQLVMVGRMPEGDVQTLTALAASLGLGRDRLLFTGYVGDADLRDLYNLCTAFVFPSWHEGFGLPVLEAMRCGRVVIGARASSVPEVIGDEEALFDPHDVADLVRLIGRALSDEDYRTRRIRQGLERAGRFSWSATAAKALQALEIPLAGQSLPRTPWPQSKSQLETSYRQLISAVKARLPAAERSPQTLVALARAIGRNAAETERVARSAVLPDSIVWRIEGPFDSSYSLALLNRETARALEALGHQVVLHSTEGPGDFPANVQFLEANPQLARMHARVPDFPPPAVQVTSRNLYPPRVNDLASRLNLLHHYAWEESGFPPEWVEQFNAHLQGITCLSRHVEKLLIDNGVAVPLTTSGCGVDHWERIEADGTYRVEARGFRFLHVSSCFPRKGADALLKAYGLAFSQADDVSLVIKTFANPHNEIHRWLAEARADRADFPDVVIIEQDLSDSELKALYQHCHVLVGPSRAEGYGLPFAEAMLSGLPVITTGWGGQLDFCNDDTAWLVDFSFAPAKTHFGLFNSVWAEPDVAHLARLLKQSHGTSPQARAERAARGRALLLSDHRWSQVVSRLTDAARRWSLPQHRKALRVGWISSWNTRCGIAAYSEHLLEHFPGDVIVLASETDAVVGPERWPVHRCWRAGGHDELHALRARVRAERLDGLVIQFNYGFFNFSKLSAFLHEMIDAGVTVIVALHATVDPVSDPSKRLVDLRDAFARCQRLLVHGVADLNRLKSLGLVDNVALFPHGILSSPSTMVAGRRSKKSFVLVSYGFFLPHKGLLELIESVALLQRSGVSVQLRMVNAEYPVPESTQLIAKARALVSSLGLGRSVEILTSYLSDADSLKLMADADAIVFPYQATAESSSAAVRFGLAAQRPVAVTPLAIFENVQEVVQTLPGTSAEDIARGLATWLDEIARDAEPVRALAARRAAWCKAHGYEALSRRLHAMLIALGRKPVTSISGLSSDAQAQSSVMS